MSHPLPRRKVVLFSTVTVVVGVLFALVLANGLLGWQQQRIRASDRMDPGLIQYDKLLGWGLTKSWQGTHSHHDFEVSYAINEHGFRGSFPDSLLKKEKPRVAVLGDSFTFGLGVNDGETFTGQLNQLDEARDYLNLAVPGYSTDQQYLLMRNRGRRLQVEHYLLVIYLGNDFLDNALPYPLQVDKAKPYFELGPYDRLELRNNPVPTEPKPAGMRQITMGSIVFGDELGAKGIRWLRPVTSSHLYKRLFVSKATMDQEAANAIQTGRLTRQTRLMGALLTAIQIEAHEQGAGLTIALLPGQSYFVAPESYSAMFQGFVQRTILGLVEEKSIPAIDVVGELRGMEVNLRELFHRNEGHLTTEGHRVVGEAVHEALTDAAPH